MVTVTCPNCGHHHFYLSGAPGPRMNCEKCRNGFPTAGRIKGTPANEVGLMDLRRLSYQEQAWLFRVAIPLICIGWVAGPANVGYGFVHGHYGSTFQVIVAIIVATLVGMLAGGIAGAFAAIVVVVVRRILRFSVGPFRNLQADRYDHEYNVEALFNGVPEATRTALGWGLTFGVPLAGFFLGCGIGKWLWRPLE